MRLRSRTGGKIPKRMKQRKICSVYFTPTKPDKLPVQPRGPGRPRTNKKPTGARAVSESPVLVKYDLDLSTVSESTSRNATPTKKAKVPVRSRGTPGLRKPTSSAYFTPIKPDKLQGKTRGPGRPRINKKPTGVRAVSESPVLVEYDLDLSTVSESTSSGAMEDLSGAMGDLSGAMEDLHDSLDFSWAVQKLQDLNQGFPPLGRSTPTKQLKSLTPQQKVRTPPSRAAKKPSTGSTKKDTSPKGEFRKKQQSNCKVTKKTSAQNTSSPSSKKCSRKRGSNSNEREDAVPMKRCKSKVSESQSDNEWHAKEQEEMADVIRAWTARKKDKGRKPWELQTVSNLPQSFESQSGSPNATPLKTLRVLVPRLETQGLLERYPAPRRKEANRNSTKQPHLSPSKAKGTKSPVKAKNGKQDKDDFSWVRCSYCSDLTIKCAMNEHVNKRHRFHCYQCKLFFHSKEERDEHRSERHHQKPKQEVTCELCEKVYASMTNFKRHLLGREHSKLERIQREALDYIINKTQTGKDGCIMIGDTEYRPVTTHRLPAIPENPDSSSNSNTPSNRNGTEPGGDSQGQTEDKSKNSSQESIPVEIEVCRSNEVSLDMTGFLESLMDIDLPTGTTCSPSTDLWTVPSSPKFRNHEALATQSVNPDNQNGDLFPTTGTSSWEMDYAEEDYGLITTATVTLLDTFPENQLPGNSDCSQVNYISL